jgi:type IV pilus assembly protein PilE
MKQARRTATVHGTGFTLIELMVIVVVVSLLAAIAYPGYQQYVKRGRRADAKAALTEMAQFMERYYSENNSYSAASLPVTTSPREGGAVYNLKFGGSCTDGSTSVGISPQAHCFLVQAIPVTDGLMDGDECGTFGLDNTGNKVVSGDAGAAQCWGR